LHRDRDVRAETRQWMGDASRDRHDESLESWRVEPCSSCYDPGMTESDRPRKRLSPLWNVAIYAALFFGIGQIVFFDIDPDSPLRGGGPGKQYNDQQSDALENISRDFAKTTAGRPFALHISIPAKDVVGDGKMNTTAGNQLAGIYYYTANRIYPRRLFIGEDDRIVNYGRDLLGPPASVQWLQDHDVAGTIDIGLDSKQRLTFPVIQTPGLYATTQP
jgi:hypothetical protein